jgi:circadian clock protein KaiB
VKKSAPPQPAPDHVMLSLYVVGTTPSSARAIVNVRKLCEEHLAGRYDLRVIDLSADPSAASQAQVIAAPTLIKQLPLPIRRFIGDMSKGDRVLAGLDVKLTPDAGSDPK